MCQTCDLVIGYMHGFLLNSVPRLHDSDQNILLFTRLNYNSVAM